jgi:hypothetical protein
MKKITILIILLSLVGCAAPTPSPTAIPTSAISGCGLQEMGKYSSIIMPIYTRWGAAVKKAYSAKPGDVATDINILQAIDAEFKGVFPPACLSDLHKALLSASDYTIKGFSAYSSGETEAKISEYFARANSMLAFIYSQMKILTDKTQQSS